jgi:hypothetical protein
MQIHLVQPIEAPRPSGHIPQASPAAFSAGYVAASQGAEALGEAAAGIAKTFRRQQIQDSEAEALNLQSKIEVTLQQQDFDLKRTETDPAAYLETRRKSFRTVSDQIAKEAKQPFTQQILTQHLTKAFTAYDERALQHADGLRVRKATSELTSTVDNFDQALALTPYTDTETIARLMAGKELAIATRAPMIGEDAATKLSIAERKKSFEEVARRHVDADPGDFLANINRYRGMDGEKRDILVERATAKLDTAERKHREDMERFYTDIEKQAEEERQGQLSTYDEKARAGVLTTADLRDARQMRIVKTPGEYDHLAALINAPPARQSDQDLKRIVAGDVFGARPKYTEADIRRFMADQATGRRGLSIDDGQTYIGRLREHAQRLEDKDYQQKGEQYRLAKEQAYKRLGLTTAFDQLDPLSKKLIADFDADFNARVDFAQKDWQGKGAPAFQVLGDILPKYMAAQKQDALLNYDQQIRLLDPGIAGSLRPEPMTPTWGDWYAVTAQKVEALKGTDPNKYVAQKAQLQNLLNARKALIDNATRAQGTDFGRAAGSRPTVGPTQ